MLRSAPVSALGLSLLASTLPAQVSCLQDLDLSKWTGESYAATNALPAGVWMDGNNGDSATQSAASNPTFFVSEVIGQSYELTGTISASDPGNGFFGIAIGFDPGESTDPDAEYWLIDWKRDDESVDWGAPSCTAGTTATAGLAISRVIGIPTADEFWGHTNESAACSDLDNGLQELARGMTSGNTGWSPATDYMIRLRVLVDSLQLWVNGNLELDIPGPFGNARIAFYNLDQEESVFSDFVAETLASTLEYGEGTPGCVGMPSVDILPEPVIGTYVDLEVSSGTNVPTHGCLVISTAPNNQATPFGFQLYVDWTSKVLLVFDPLPPQPVTLNFPIPNESVLCGVSLYMQLFHFDLCASGNVAASPGLSVSAGVSAKLIDDEN